MTEKVNSVRWSFASVLSIFVYVNHFWYFRFCFHYIFVLETPPPPLIIQRCVTARVRSDFAKDVKIMCLWVTPIWPNILKAHSWKVWLRLCAIFTLLYLNKENIKYDWACMYRLSFQWVSVMCVQIYAYIIVSLHFCPRIQRFYNIN